MSFSDITMSGNKLLFVAFLAFLGELLSCWLRLRLGVHKGMECNDDKRIERKGMEWNGRECI